ncbi:hypothetical protein GE09DRAFT_1160594 [Coniochaeta sp. 2T2.1]|nr:hypothetical protein GE09DRAFT_1160594 [Coniochaeta sp. 2T2.1]
MATTYGSAAPDMSSHPWAYVAIPLAVVVGLGLMAVALHTHRRKRLQKARLQYVGSNPAARRALERDIQEAWARGAPQEETRQQRRAMRMWRRDANGGGRWAWARDMLTARSEEGLNEFGEAPPPYDGRKGSKVGEGDAVELEERNVGSSSGLGTAAGGAGASGLHTEDLEAGRTLDQQRDRDSQQSLPPAYSGPPAATGSARISAPPPALVPGSRLSHLSA